MNERWRETPEWIAIVIAVRPMMRLEHCHIATLVQIIVRTNEALRGNNLHADNNEEHSELQFKEREELGVDQKSLRKDKTLSKGLTKAVEIQAWSGKTWRFRHAG
jgi:hypothetical protein